MARPLLTTEKINTKLREKGKEDYKTIVDNLMSAGASLEEIDAELEISKKTRIRIMKTDKEFFHAIKRGIKKSKAWWLKQGRINLENRNFSAVLWYMNMKNRFGWRDRQQTDITSGDKPIPLLNITNGIIQQHDSDKEDMQPNEEN